MNVLITGASGGIGSLLAVELSPSNDLVLVGKSHQKLQAVRNFCLGRHQGRPGTIQVVAVDLARDTGGIGDAIQKLPGERVDVFINAAGLYQTGDFCDIGGTPVDKGKLLRMFEMIDVNFTRAIGLLYAVMPALAPGGMIVNLNSLSGKNISPNEAVYSATKHAMAGFMKAFRFEARDKGLRVMDVFLGATNTAMTNGRKGQDKMMSAGEAARIIAGNIEISGAMKTLQIEELQLGRIIF